MNFSNLTKLVFALVFGSILLSGCQKFPVVMLGESVESYFQHPTASGHKWEEYGNGLFGFQYGLDRSFVIKTDEGLVVIESFNEPMAKHLKKILEEKFPGQEVTHLFYSHQHLDHTSGGWSLKPKEVWAPKNSQLHFEEYYSEKDTLKPTHYIEGTQILNIGGREIHVFDFKGGHAQSLFAFYFKKDKLLYGPDLALCETFWPFGFPDFNHYGHVKIMEQAEKLDFDRFIASHFKNGDKSCVTGSKELLVDTRNATIEAYKMYGSPAHNLTAEYFRNVMFHIQDKLEPKYSDWHGYDTMGIPAMTRQLGGVYLGH